MSYFNSIPSNTTTNSLVDTETGTLTNGVDFSSGNGVLNIEPGLAVACSGGETLIYKDVAFTVRLDNTTQEWNMGLASTVGYDIDFREAL